MANPSEQPPDTWIDTLIARRLAGDVADPESCSSETGVPAPLVSQVITKLDRIERARRRVERERAGDDTAESVSVDLPPIAAGYVALKEIARGGQAIVYLARRASSGNLVALKVQRDRLGGELRRQQRFESEVEILRKLDHPQIVPLIDSGTTVDGDRFLATRFIDGPMLDPKTLSQTKPVEWRLSVMISLCRAVQAAHQHGVVHRDLKPSNVRFDENGRPVVLDFGLARQAADESMRHSLTTTGEFLGTFLWASPEQAAGASDVGPSSDVYSLGVILHQLFCGGRFPPQVHATVRTAIEPETAPRRSGSFPQLEVPSLAPILRKSLATEPQSRYADAGELADAIEKLQRAGPRSSRRHTGLAAAATVIGVFVCGLAALLGPHLHPSGPATFREMSTERTLINGRPILRLLGMRFVYCPPGEFMMGSTPDEGPGLADSRTRRLAKVEKGFYLGQAEVTQGTWANVMTVNPSRFVSESLPVDRVSHNAAKEFCRKASEITGRSIRLPTEIEWEYACRAGTQTSFFWGSDPKLMLRYGNAADRAAAGQYPVESYLDYDDGYAATAPGGTFLANPWRLVDMLGNVWEWCEGPYQVDPTDAATAVEGRMPVRGGSWWDPPFVARCSNRNALAPESHESTLGLRVVLDDSHSKSP